MCCSPLLTTKDLLERRALLSRGFYMSYQQTKLRLGQPLCHQPRQRCAFTLYPREQALKVPRQDDVVVVDVEHGIFFAT